ncbi:ACT domain-containing protein [Nakamurella sp.]|uniref:ACT domain-containing protein n=1 Tax=Nakamurella sp. TaxID=1869182 RepID=UPI003B3A94D2
MTRVEAAAAPSPTVVLVAAVARNGVIGADGGMPWHIPADLRRFRSITMGHPMVMGRRTFESMGALPGRRSIVITRDRAWRADGAEVADSLDTALSMAATTDDLIMVVGGGQIYAQAIDRADRLEITHLDREAPGDTVFPAIDPGIWAITGREDGDGLVFATYTRRSPLRDLADLVRSMEPQLLAGEFEYCTVPGPAVPAGLSPVATVREPEGLTLILPADEAAAAGLPGGFRCRQITLRVPSALDAVGLTAAVAGALADDGMACNVVAGFHHDHLFVPAAQADRAMAALAALAHTRTD